MTPIPSPSIQGDALPRRRKPAVSAELTTTRATAVEAPADRLAAPLPASPLHPGGSVLREWRVLSLGLLAGVSTFDPNFALRFGAVLCALLLVSMGSRLRFRSADLFAILLTAWAALSLLWAADSPTAQLSLKNQLAVLAIFLSVRVAVSDLRQLVIVALGYSAGCAFSLYQLITQNRGSAFTAELSAQRLGVEGVNLNYLAYSLAAGLALTVLLWSIRRPIRLMRLGIFALVPFIGFGLIQSGSRGAVAGAAMLIVWLVGWRLLPGRGLATPVFAFCLAAVATAAGWLDGWLLGVDASLTRSTGDLAGRLSVWPYAREVIRQEPLTGIGAGCFRASNPMAIGAHNVVLEVTSGLGLIGLALLAAVAYQALIAGTRSTEPRTRRLVVGAIIAVSAPIVLSGHWELSPAAWFILALFSRLDVLPSTRTGVTGWTGHGRPPRQRAEVRP
jgi:O-antigen ligase